MVEDTSWIVGRDGTKLFLRRWEPEKAKICGVVHIVHGMAEHSGRYVETASRLAERGYAVWIVDLRGHGRTANPAINDEGRGGLLGHCADKNAFDLILQDIETINAEITQKYPALPLFILGHSFGSFLVQGYIETYRMKLSGCILSGTRGYSGMLTAVGAVFMTIFALVRGVRARSKFALQLADGSYNKPFKPNKTPFDWGSRDEKEVEDFVNDSLCGNLSTAGFYRDLALCLLRIYKKHNIEKISRTLPIYMFSGSADPVGDMGKGPTALVKRFRAMGSTDLEFVLYPDGRHEMLHETNKKEVTDNLCAWLDKHA